jgi:hypothetical protein
MRLNGVTWLCPGLGLVKDFQLMKGAASTAKPIPYIWRLDWIQPVAGAELSALTAGVITGIAVYSLAKKAPQWPELTRDFPNAGYMSTSSSKHFLKHLT